MQILLIHADYLKFEVKQRTPVAEEVKPEDCSGQIDEVLVVFSAAEEADAENVEEVARKAAQEISSIALPSGRVLPSP